MPSVRDLMVPDPVCLAPTDTLRFAAGVLTSIGAGGAPVMKGKRLVGVVSTTDILEFAADNPSLPELPIGQGGKAQKPAREEEASSGGPGSMAVPKSPDWDSLDEHTVAEVMSMRILSLPPDADASAAIRLMDEESVHRVLVLDGDELVGIVTAWDVVRSVARGEFVPADGGAGGAGVEGPRTERA
jgi:CBS domain-containing protein